MSRVQSLEKGIRVLELLAGQNRGLNVTEISNALEMPYATTYRLVQTLYELGYLDCDDSNGRYLLSIKVLRWHGSVLQRLSVPRVAYGPMVELMERFHETVHLAVLDSGDVVYLETVLGSRSLSMYTLTGKRAPVHSTALGKALLAHKSPLEAKQIAELKGLTRFTPNTICDLDDLITELEQIRRQGFSVDDEEMEIGVRCVASHIVNHEGRVVAAISVSAPAARMPHDRVPEIAKAVISTCERISKDLGATSID